MNHKHYSFFHITNPFLLKIESIHWEIKSNLTWGGGAPIFSTSPSSPNGDINGSHSIASSHTPGNSVWLKLTHNESMTMRKNMTISYCRVWGLPETQLWWCSPVPQLNPPLALGPHCSWVPIHPGSTKLQICQRFAFPWSTGHVATSLLPPWGICMARYRAGQMSAPLSNQNAH